MLETLIGKDGVDGCWLLIEDNLEIKGLHWKWIVGARVDWSKVKLEKATRNIINSIKIDK